MKPKRSSNFVLPCMLFLLLLLTTEQVVKAWHLSSPIITNRGSCHAATTTTTALSMVRAYNKGREESMQTKTANVLQKGLQQLGRGILFAKPVGPTVSQALFGLRAKRKNDKKETSTTASSFALSLREAAWAIAAYWGIGVLFYSVVQGWTIIDSIYFSMSVFTTVGYGDLVPTSAMAKMFTCLFSLGGVAILAAALAAIGSQVIVETESKVARTWTRQWLPRLRETCRGLLPARCPKQPLPTSSSSSPTAVPSVTAKVTAVVPFRPPPTQVMDHQAKPPPTVHPAQVLVQVLPRLGLLVSLGMFVGHLEGWNVLDSVYYSISTASTIGFGDKAPTRQVSRLLAAVCIPLAVATGGEILGTIAAAVWKRRRAALFESVVQKDFCMDHIKEMDSNGDGQVSKLDYLEFMLVEMQLIEKGVIEELESQFDRLDMTKRGTLSKKDLILMVKMRRRRHQEMDAAVVDVDAPVTSMKDETAATALKSAHIRGT